MSLNGDSYHSLDSTVEVKPKATAATPKAEGYGIGMVLAIALLFGAFCATAAIGLAYSDEDSAVYNPSSPYVMPNKAIITATFKAPYFDEQFAQTVTVYVDHENERSRLEYYSGANTFITNKKANSTNISIVPQYDRLVCFKDFHVNAASLPTIFPKLQYHEGESSGDDDDDHGPKLTATATQHMLAGAKMIPLYTKQPGTEVVNNVTSHKWTYSYIQHANATYDYLTPDKFNHVGNYTFYVDAKTGAPVRFHMLGHNVFNAGSHMEEYYVDYHSVVAVNSLPQSLFEAPNGMPCVDDHIESSKRHRSPVDVMMGAFSHEAPEHREVLQDSLFESWSKQHQKVYNSAQEKAVRKENFFKTSEMITAHNANPSKSYTMGLNSFADMTAEELRLMSGRRSRAASSSQSNVAKVPDACTQYVPVDGALPEKIDWRTDARLEKYLNTTLFHHDNSQISCGSCFAQGLTRATTAQYYLVNGEKTPFDPSSPLVASVQHVLDCSNGPTYDNYACNGGIDFQVASWVLNENNGLIAEDTSYGFFRNANGFCHYAVNDKTIDNINPWTGKVVEAFTTMTNCEHVGNQWNKEEEMDLVQLVKDTKNALANHGPLSISIAVPQSLYYYQSGIYDDAVECGHLNDDLTHTVTLVAYDDTDDSWTFMNSWSQTWGVDGAAKIKMTGNVCGVATTPLAIHVEKK